MIIFDIEFSLIYRLSTYKCINQQVVILYPQMVVRSVRTSICLCAYQKYDFGYMFCLIHKKKIIFDRMKNQGQSSIELS